MKPILHQAIRIQFKPCRLMLGLLSLISIICCCILLALPMAPTIKFLGILLVVSSSVYFILRDALLMLPWSWQVLEIDTKGILTIKNMRGQVCQPSLADSTFIHAKLTILNFKREGFRCALPPAILINAGDNMDDLRRLRVWLRWATSTAIRHQADLVLTAD